MQLRKQVGLGVIGRTGTMLVAFLGSIALARMIGDSGYGQFYFLLAVVSLLDNPFTGWMSGCRKRMTEKGFDRSEGIGAILLMIVISSLMIGSISVIVDPLFVQNTIYIGLLFFGSISFIGMNKMLKSTDNYSRSYFMDMLRDILRVVLQITFVLLIGDVFGMVLGIFAANVLVASVILRYDISVPSVESLKSIGVYAKSASIEGVVGTLLSRMDILFLGWLATDAVVGNYQVALNLSMPAMVLGSVIGTGVLNEVSYDDSVGDDSSQTIQHAMNYASLLAIPMLAGAIVFGDIVVVTIYSSEFQIAGTFIAGLCAYRVFHAQNSVLTSTINGIDRPEFNLRVSTGVLVANVIFGLILFFEYGPIGFVFATVLAAGLRFIVSYLFVRSKFDIRISSREIMSQLMASSIMATIVFIMRQSVSLDIPMIGIILGIGGLSYFGSLYLISGGFRGLAHETLESVVG